MLMRLIKEGLVLTEGKTISFLEVEKWRDLFPVLFPVVEFLVMCGELDVVVVVVV